MMNTVPSLHHQSFMTLHIPLPLYTDLLMLAGTTQATPVDVIAHLVAMALRQQLWQQDVHALREHIRADGGLHVSDDDELLIEQLRATRQEIFEAEYAHLYR
jgi:hypothetical protein